MVGVALVTGGIRVDAVAPGPVDTPLTVLALDPVPVVPLLDQAAHVTATTPPVDGGRLPGS
ncbi:hypothetical protein ACFYOT_24235 [Saccharothrix saharensis]|uniref:hypothetical protein n=1 Tax=Saccharothrix saharensis TaxID=571190 RepID=UPI0036BD9C8F